MGVVSSKSPLERRNTVLRRSQRKSIHGVKSKAEKLAKDIRKFKGAEENSDYVELKARIETAERELRTHSKNLQPQIRNIYADALKKTEECHKLLDDKLKENQEKLNEAQEKAKEQQAKKQEEEPHDDGDDDVFVEEVTEEEHNVEPSERRKTVELKVIQVEQIEASPQINKRFSAMKLGVPVLPGSLLESIQRKTEESNLRNEEKVASIRKEIETLENEISQFVGRKNGRYYNKIKTQLDGYFNQLQTLSSTDEDILEQIKLCKNYVGSCVSFLDEKAVERDGDDVDDDDYDEVPSEKSSDVVVAESNLSPRSMRTTYI